MNELVDKKDLIDDIYDDKKEYIEDNVPYRNGTVERTFKFTDVGGITPMRLLWGEYLKNANKIDKKSFLNIFNLNKEVVYVMAYKSLRGKQSTSACS